MVVLVEPPLYTVGVEPDIASLGSLVSLDATARDDKPVEGLPTRWVTATLSTGDVVGLNLTGSTGPTGTWQSTWPVRPGTDGERVVDFRGEDEGGQVGHGETALVIDTLLPGPPWMSSPRGTTWVGRPQVTVVGQGAPLSRLRLELDGAPARSTIIDANGEWVIEQPLSGAEHRLRTRLTDLAGNQSGFSNGATVKVDLEPPQVTLTAPPVSEGSFTVEWAGDDGDGSGVIAYQVEYQDNGGSWKTLLTETLDFEAPFSGELYHEYTFRVRARDLVGHVSDWITSTVAIVNQTKYYFLEGRRVAMRKGDKVYYLYGDHLGSTTLATDEDGNVTYDARYLPYGGGRLSNGVSPTDFGFTDQRHEIGLGLIDYHARYYDPFLGRFISPDTIVPAPNDPQAFNRYSYVSNNPLRYIDPSGHQGCDAGDQSCWDNRWYRARGYENVEGAWQYTGSFQIEAGDSDFYTKGVLDMHKAKIELKNVAEATWNDFGSVEAMARVIELAAALSGDNAGVFMDLTIPVLSGESGTGIVWDGWIPQQSGRGPDTNLYHANKLRTNGFAPMYADPDVTNNQVHHVWYEAQLAYYYGHGFAVAANVWHETFDWTSDSGGKSLQDVNSGLVGNRIGAGLRRGTLRPSQVAAEIRFMANPDTRRCFARNRCGGR